jgi:translation initiation factor 1
MIIRDDRRRLEFFLQSRREQDLFGNIAKFHCARIIYQFNSNVASGVAVEYPCYFILQSQIVNFIDARGNSRKYDWVMSGKQRIPGDGRPLEQKPFAGLDSAGLPPGPATQATPAPQKKRGRVDILRQTAHRGGKTVTVIKNFVGIGLPEKEKLAKQMQKACGTGGTVKDGQIEIQGDKRNEVARILIEAGFQPVFAGG